METEQAGFFPLDVSTESLPNPADLFGVPEFTVDPGLGSFGVHGGPHDAMSLLVPPRRPSHERLDDPALPAEEMRRSLEDLRLVNRRFGGLRPLVRHVLERVRGTASGRPR